MIHYCCYHYYYYHYYKVLGGAGRAGGASALYNYGEFTRLAETRLAQNSLNYMKLT